MAETQVDSSGREQFCRRLSELLGIDSGALVSGEMQAASLGKEKYLLMLCAGESKATCNLLLADGYAQCVPQSLLAHEALGLPDAGGMPYYDTSQGMPGWRWSFPDMCRDSASRLVSDISAKLIWLDDSKSQSSAAGKSEERTPGAPAGKTDQNKGLLV